MDRLCSVELMRLIVGQGVAETKCKVMRMNMMVIIDTFQNDILANFQSKIGISEQCVRHKHFLGRLQGKASFQNQLRFKDMNAHLFSKKMKENIFFGTNGLVVIHITQSRGITIRHC